MVALGGVAVSWIASSILAEHQAAEAAAQAREEVDQKLDNLSRVFGQAAGQISQAVEQAELQQIPAATGFALVSQATRMIYGQVNEIGVIRGVKFDAARLLETASMLDDLARQLSGSSNKTDDVNEVRRKIQVVQETLSTVTPQRQMSEVVIDCPYCNRANHVRLGNLPGDSATATCTNCSDVFNVHRTGTGTAFTRPRVPAASLPAGLQPVPLTRRWTFQCPKCQKRLSAIEDGRGIRPMVCTTCLTALDVEPAAQMVSLALGYTKIDASNFARRAKRPKILCPTCGETRIAMLSGDRGFVGMCIVDKFVFEVPYADFEAFYLSETGEPLYPTPRTIDS